MIGTELDIATQHPVSFFCLAKSGQNKEH